MLKLSQSTTGDSVKSEMSTRGTCLGYRVHPLLVTLGVIGAKEIKTLRVHLKGVVVPRTENGVRLEEKNCNEANSGVGVFGGVYPCFLGASTARQTISEAFRAPLGVEFLSLS